jgi:hypothetical protein
MEQTVVINRAGADGFVSEMRIQPLRGKPFKVKTRSTLMVNAAGRRPNLDALTRQLGVLTGNVLTLSGMLSALSLVRQTHGADSVFLKVAFHHKVSRYDFTCAFECWVRVARIKSYVSVAMPYPKRNVTRLTVEVSAENPVHYEELLSLVDETPAKKPFEFIAELAGKLDQYQRILDYLILLNQVTKDGTAGLVVQKWGGVPGGLQPMPGLERFVPDV